jgi:hypothetical protein
MFPQYNLRASCDDVHTEVKALLAPDATAEDCGRLLALLDDIAKSGAAARNRNVLADGYPRGLRVHRLSFNTCAVFYTYATGAEPALYLLGFCPEAQCVRHLPVVANRLVFVP